MWAVRISGKKYPLSQEIQILASECHLSANIHGGGWSVRHMGFSEMCIASLPAALLSGSGNDITEQLSFLSFER